MAAASLACVWRSLCQAQMKRNEGNAQRALPANTSRVGGSSLAPVWDSSCVLPANDHQVSRDRPKQVETPGPLTHLENERMFPNGLSGPDVESPLPEAGGSSGSVRQPPLKKRKLQRACKSPFYCFYLSLALRSQLWIGLGAGPRAMAPSGERNFSSPILNC